MPTEDMLRDIDVLLIDIQDIGARTYTYHFHPQLRDESGGPIPEKPVIVLDRPNPLGGEIVEAPVLEDAFRETFVGGGQPSHGSRDDRR